MRKLLLVAVAASLFLLFAAPLEAQVRWGLRAGIADGDPMVGVELVTPLAAGFMLNPNLEFSTDLFTANADVHYDFTIAPRTHLWLGAGLAFVNPRRGDYEGGVNLLAGVGAQRNRVYPYGQVKFTSVSDIDDILSVAVGVRF